MSGSRWVITPSWLSGSWKYFLYSSSVYSCHLSLISSASVRSIPFVLYYAQLCMKCSLGISTFLEEMSSLPHSVVFLYSFALITEEGFLIFPCYSLEFCISEDEMAGWHHGLDERESEWTLGDGDGQGGLAWCDSWGCKELDTTEWLNWTELKDIK